MDTPPIGRRAQNRLERHQKLMEAATEIISAEGLNGLTMQAVAERVDCAVGTIYTYFPSKTALLAELQITAIETLGESFRLSSAMWEDDLAAAGVDDGLAALTRLVAFGHLFTAGPELHPREFELLQVLLSARGEANADDDARSVLQRALGLINMVTVLVDEAVENGVLTAASDDPDAAESSMSRTLRWAGGLNGALLVSNVGTDPRWLSPDLLDGRRLALRLADDLLLGWGAPPMTLAKAKEIVADLDSRDRLIHAGTLTFAEPTVD